MTSLGQAAVFVAAGMVAGRFLGFVRELLLAHQFGTTVEMDALVVALAIPDGMTNILLGGPLAVAIVPALAEYARDGANDRFNSVAWPLLTIGTCITAVGAAAGVITAPAIIHFLTPGLEQKTAATAATCLRVALLAVPFTGTALIAIPILQARRSFRTPSIATVVFNLTLIASIIVLAPAYGVEGVVWGAVLAAIVRAILLHRAVGAFLRRPTVLSFNNEHWRLLRIIPAAIVASALRDVYLFIDRAFAAHLPAGGISALSYADRLTQLPLGLIAGTAASSLMPFMALSASCKDNCTIGVYTRAGVSFAVITLVPAAIAFSLLAEPIVSSVYMRGAFGPDAVHVTSNALSIIAISVPFQGISAVLTASLFVARRQTAALSISLCAIALHAVTNQMLVPSMGYVGVAISITFCYVVHAFALGALQARRLALLNSSDLLDVAKIGVVTVSTGVILTFTLRLFVPIVGASHEASMVTGFIVTGAAFSAGMFALFPGLRTVTSLRTRLLPTDQ